MESWLSRELGTAKRRQPGWGREGPAPMRLTNSGTGTGTGNANNVQMSHKHVKRTGHVYFTRLHSMTRAGRPP